tara:strand:+ start:105 stop:443 length:339 start_codon:yes stop_codon:yes gene_type:complete
MPKAIKRGDPPFKKKSDPKITGPKNLPPKEDKVFWRKVNELKKRSDSLATSFNKEKDAKRQEVYSKRWKAANKELDSMVGKGTNYYEHLKEVNKPYSERKSNRTDLPKTLKK